MLFLGNVAPIERRLTNPETGEHETVHLAGTRTTMYGAPPEWPLMEKLQTLAGGNGSWEWVSEQPPAWVEADAVDAVFAQVVAEHYGCPVGRPEDWIETPESVDTTIQEAPQ